MPSRRNRTPRAFHSIDMVAWTRRSETAMSAAIRTIVVPRASSISSTPGTAIPPRDSLTANLSLHTCWRPSTTEKQWV